MKKEKGCDCEASTATEPITETENAAASEDLAHRFARYLNAATSAPREHLCRLEGFELPGECKRDGECKLEGDWLNFFYWYAIEFLDDIMWASHGDDKAARRIAKLAGVFEKKQQQPPAIQRAAEIHAIMHTLRWVTAPHNEDELIQVVEESEDKVVYVLSDGEGNERVELRDLEFLEQPCDPNDKFKNIHEQLKNSYDRPEIKDLYDEAKKHWHQKATLQSLALDIYLTRHGFVKKDDRERAREGLRRDLRKMRQAKLTVFVNGFDCGCEPEAVSWAMPTESH